MKMGKALLIVAFDAASATALAAGDKISAEDFVKKAGEAGAAEVAMGKLGAAKATDTEVKAFAEHMVKDHTKANQELMAAAKSKGLKVSAEPGVMHKGMKEKFEHQSADADFNHDFMQQMVKDHESAVELFRGVGRRHTRSRSAGPGQEDFAHVEEHLAEAKKLESKLGKSERGARDA